MYHFLRAQGKKRRRSSRWETIDIAHTPIRTVSSQYADVWLFLQVDGEDRERALRLESLVNLMSTRTDATVTTTAFITALGNQTLPFADTAPTFTQRYVRYAQAWHAGYRIDPIARLGTVERQTSKFEKEDLLIRRDDVDSALLGRRALFSVNGLFHAHDTGEDGVHILEGNTSVRHANDNQVGLLSFSEIGDIQCLSLKPEWISAQQDGAPLRHAVYLTVPEEIDLRNKTCLLVVGGYLQALDDSYLRTGDQRWRIELQRLELAQRYFDSRDSIDLSSLNLHTYPGNDTLVATEEFFADDTIMAYLTLPQTFLVVVDIPEMFHELEPVEYAGMVQRYYNYQHDHLPLVGAYGRALEYHAVEEYGKVVLPTTPNYRHRYDFQTRDWVRDGLFDDGRYPAHPFQVACAYIRRLGTEY